MYRWKQPDPTSFTCYIGNTPVGKVIKAYKGRLLAEISTTGFSKGIYMDLTQIEEAKQWVEKAYEEHQNWLKQKNFQG